MHLKLFQVNFGSHAVQFSELSRYSRENVIFFVFQWINNPYMESRSRSLQVVLIFVVFLETHCKTNQVGGPFICIELVGVTYIACTRIKLSFKTSCSWSLRVWYRMLKHSLRDIPYCSTVLLNRQMALPKNNLYTVYFTIM